MRILVLVAGLFLQGLAVAQSPQQAPIDRNYNYVELRFVDVDPGSGDGIRFNGSYDLGNDWLIVGGLTALDFNNNVDSTAFELGAGYVWDYSADFDLVSTLRYVRVDFDTPAGSGDESGFAFSAGARGFLTREIEIRGSVNHVNLDNSDTYLELAGDYYFTDRFAAGLSLEFAGDVDAITIGARWFFR